MNATQWRLPDAPLLASAVASELIGLAGVDGWVARRHRIASPFGARFDMEVDALLTLASPSIQPPLGTLLAAAALITLGYSFPVDTLWLWRHAA